MPHTSNSSGLRDFHQLLLTEAIKNEDEIVAEIEKVWGKLLNTSGEAVLGVEKERFEMIDGDREITRGELEKAWSKIKRGKAMDESGVCGEYLRALTEEAKGRASRIKFINLLPYRSLGVRICWCNMDLNERLTKLNTVLRRGQEQDSIVAVRQALSALFQLDEVNEIPEALLSVLVTLLHSHQGSGRQLHQLASHLLSLLSPLHDLPALRLTSECSDQQFAHTLHVLSNQMLSTKLCDLVPQLIRWISTVSYSSVLQSRCLATLILIATEHPYWLTKDQHHVTDVQMSEWLSKASLHQAANPFSRGFFRSPKESEHQPPVTEIDGSMVKDMFTVLCVGQFFTDDQVLNLHSFARTLRWLSSVDKTAFNAVSPSSRSSDSTPLLVPSAQFGSWNSNAAASSFDQSSLSMQSCDSDFSEIASELPSSYSNESPALSMLSERVSPSDSMVSGTSKWNETIQTLDLSTVAQLTYCLRLMHQSGLRVKSGKDLEIQQSSLIEAIRIVDVVCQQQQTVFHPIIISIHKLIARENRQSSPRVLIALTQFVLNNGHVMGLDPTSVYDRLFGFTTAKHFSQNPFAFDLLCFLRDHLETLSLRTNVLSKYFPNILKIVAWQPQMYLNDLLELLPAFMSADTTVEIFHCLLELPCVTAAIEMGQCQLERLSAKTALHRSVGMFQSTSKKALFNYILRNESGVGDTVDRLEDVHSILAVLSKSPRVRVCSEVVPSLLRCFFAVLLEEANLDTLSCLVPVILDRVTLLFQIPEFQSSVRSILQNQLVLCFNKFPQLVIEQYSALSDYLSQTTHAQSYGEFYLHVMWLVGQHLSTAHDQRCTPHQLTSLYELLEALCYELLGLQRSVVLSEGATCSARFISVLLSTLAKLASRSQDLIPRTLLCLSKFEQLHRMFPEGAVLRDRAKELKALLRVPNVATLVLSPTDDIVSRRCHVDASSLPALLSTTNRLLPL
ncbi:hypothetical protein CAPTEDRAFT_227527 [Capitella teleta]|uniref:AP-5 complex subunit zeta-1 n=1 Tax=Capitella teleta TaxID=283909 RepID=R7URZ0_CAPTE|nr:hypothetical protein CAPTEDRAFT_227527 [Capitella teleta]|eukprot:ELU06156.1 hypothetical protein CAPTEDRAFT_227527 [Capitella teleta]